MTLSRRTPLRSVTPLASVTPIPTRSKKKQKAAASERRVKAIVRVRCMALNDGRCEICGRNPARDPAHRLASGRGGEWRASNILAACGPCHDAQRDGKGGEALATKLGQVLPSLVDGVKPDPQKVPVACVYGWSWLRDNGDVVPATSAVMVT